jgi:lipopolysaccharide export LptBFGC system permease protein LptF
MRARPLTLRRVGPIAALAVLASCLTFVVLEWLVPYANQAFRDLTFGGQIVRV